MEWKVSKEWAGDRNSAQREQRLNERLNQVVHEHHQWLAQLENEELSLLRTECLKLQNEIHKLSEEAINLRESGHSEITPMQRTAEPAEKPVSSQSTKGSVSDTAQKFPELMLQEEEEVALSHPPKARVLEDREAEFVDLKQKFHDLDPEHKGYISFGAIAHHLLAGHHITNADDQGKVLMKYRTVIYKLNCQHGNLAQIDGHPVLHEDHDGKTQKPNTQDYSPMNHPSDLKFHVYYSTFKTIMLENIDVLHKEFGADMTQAIIDLRQALVDDLVKERICEAWRINKEDVEAMNVKAGQRDLKLRVRQYLEPMVATMIILNALSIGMSLDNDPDWDGWVVFECFFTSFFLVEILLTMWIEGCNGFCIGDDWAWNWFDAVVVLFAVLDIILSVEGWEMRHFTVLRLVRIIRIARLLRILRLKMFKELALMVNGVIAGLRTLFWAIVLLTIFVYALGVMMRQLMDNTERNGFNCVQGDGSTGKRIISSECNRDGCNAPDGTPLVWHLWDTHGPVVVVGYVSSFLFISFGVLNLIMAVFVENTLQNAEKTDAERQFGEQSRPTKARELQILLNKFCKEQRSGSMEELRGLAKKKGSTGLKRSIEKFKGKISRATSDGTFNDNNWPMQMRVTQDQFEEILQDIEVNDILDDLDISCISREQLFDILDSDGNGFLAISELVDGIMKLRGPLDKGDGVASVLMIRHLQKQVSKFEGTMRNHSKRVDNFFASLQKRHGMNCDDNLFSPRQETHDAICNGTSISEI